MPDSPLILFADPTSVNKARRFGGPSDFHYPSHQRQVERLAPKFNALKQALDKGRIKIAQNPDGASPEYTLVLEVAGDPSGFETAVRHLRANTDDIEWLFETADDNVPNVDDFYRTKNGDRDDTKKDVLQVFLCCCQSKSFRRNPYTLAKFSAKSRLPISAWTGRITQCFQNTKGYPFVGHSRTLGGNWNT